LTNRIDAMPMSVTEAVNSRSSVRDFLPEPVPTGVLERVLTTASRAPSGGNLQPWHIDVVTGDKLAGLKAIMQRRLGEVAAGDRSEEPEYDIYPRNLAAPYRDYRFKVGEDMYRLLGVPREDKPGRLRWFSRNYQFFGAPAALFCTVDRAMGPPQWSDLGMFLQTVMLLLREEGLDSCPQECWSAYPATIRTFLGTPSNRMLFCGMSIGYRNPDHPVNALRTERTPLEDYATFHGT
jgi:nitroreductase